MKSAMTGATSTSFTHSENRGSANKMATEYSDMTQEQIDEFLHGSHHGIFAINRIDAPPQITAIWYLYEGGKIYIAIFADGIKYQSLKRDPRVGICVAKSSCVGTVRVSVYMCTPPKFSDLLVARPQPGGSRGFTSRNGGCHYSETVA